MKKILILVLLLLTGCNIKYELKFENETLEEIITVKFDKKEKNNFEELKNTDIYAIYGVYGRELYNFKYQNGIFSKTAKYSYQYNLDNFEYALYANRCFDAFSFITQDDNYILSTSTGFNCMSLSYYFIDNISIVLQTNHIVIESNADEIKGNKLIWNIDTNNAKNKKLYVKFGKVKELNFYEKILKFIVDNSVSFIAFGIMFIIISMSVIIIVIISKKNNEID